MEHILVKSLDDVLRDRILDFPQRANDALEP
jgi:hypothetical protein